VSNIDENIINELRKKLGYSREQILRGLKSEGENQIKVACALVIDHQRMINKGIYIYNLFNKTMLKIVIIVKIFKYKYEYK